MATSLAHVGDRLLGLFLPTAEAGACVPENGHQCKCINHNKYVYNCFGQCVFNCIHCCNLG